MENKIIITTLLFLLIVPVSSFAEQKYIFRTGYVRVERGGITVGKFDLPVGTQRNFQDDENVVELMNKEEFDSVTVILPKEQTDEALRISLERELDRLAYERINAIADDDTELAGRIKLERDELKSQLEGLNAN